MAAIMEAWTYPLLLAVIPSLGAALGMCVWSKPEALRISALLVTLLTLLTLIVVTGELIEPVAGLPLLYLLPLAAFLSLLGQPTHHQTKIAWPATLILLGLGLGALAGQGRLGQILLLILLGLVGLLVYRYKTVSGRDSWWGIGTYTIGIVSLMVTLIAVPPVSSHAFLVTCAILLPLVPFHGGYVAVLTRLPGNLPAFLALLLPSLGFQKLLTILPGMPDELGQILVILALSGAVYGSLKALVQSRVLHLFAYANLAFFSILWWYLSAVRTYAPQGAVYLSAVGLVTSGLLLAWHTVQARYGDVDLRAIGGLAHLMPRFATLLSLLMIAAVGLPPFGVFSGFMGMLLDPSLTLSWALLVIVGAWLTASWYFLSMVQRLLFGRHRPDLRYEDLRINEWAPLLVLVLILMALGMAPAHVFESGTPTDASYAAMEFHQWHR